MDKFKITTSYKGNIMKTIRFPTNLNNKICKVVENANNGKTAKQYSFNSFVYSECEFALKNLSDEIQYNEEELSNWKNIIIIS